MQRTVGSEGPVHGNARRESVRRISAVSILAFWASVAVFHAAEGRIKIHDLAATPPFVIQQAGHYILTRGIPAGSHPIGIIVGADDVFLDLNGFSVTGSSLAIQIENGRKNVTIFNGHIVGGQDAAIEHDPGALRAQIRLHDLEIRGSGINIPNAEEVEILRCKIRQTSGASILVTGAWQVRVEDNMILGSGGAGIRIGSQHAQVRRNNVTQGGGISLFGAQGSIIEENTVRNSGSPGIQVGSNSLVLHNIVNNSNGQNLEIGNYCSVIGNHIIGGTQEGMTVSGRGNRIIDNIVTVGGPDRSGIVVGSRANLLEGNHIGDAGTGIQFIGLAVDNICRGNLVVDSMYPSSGPPQIDDGHNFPPSLCQ